MLILRTLLTNKVNDDFLRFAANYTLIMIISNNNSFQPQLVFHILYKIHFYSRFFKNLKNFVNAILIFQYPSMNCDIIMIFTMDLLIKAIVFFPFN